MSEEGGGIPMYFELPQGERPPTSMTGDSEVYLLEMINTGRLLVSMFETVGRTRQEEAVCTGTAPEWEAEETYYDAITDILQAADYAGFDVELCARTRSATNAAAKQRQRNSRSNYGDTPHRAFRLGDRKR